MRRTDREVTDVQKMKVILDRCKIVSYAMWDGEKPYAVIMNFGYEFTPEGKLRLYSHSALDGKKVSIIRGIYRHQTGVVPSFPEGAENFVTMFCLECDEYSCKICVK